MMSTMVTLTPTSMEERAPYNLLTSIAAPRPIAWVSTISAEGVANIAPFSFYNAVAGFPPTIMFSVSYRERGEPKEKDTLRNVREVGEFVSHVVDEKMADAMIKTSANYPYGINEFDIAQIETIPSIDVRPPRVCKRTGGNGMQGNADYSSRGCYQCNGSWPGAAVSYSG